MLTTEERHQIAETLALHAYIADENQLDQLDEIFTPDAVYDMSASGIGVFDGADNIRAAAVQMSASGYAPTAHFVTNVIIAEDGPAAATAKSRGLMIMHDGTIHAVTTTMPSARTKAAGGSAVASSHPSRSSPANPPRTDTELDGGSKIDRPDDQAYTRWRLVVMARSLDP